MIGAKLGLRPLSYLNKTHNTMLGSKPGLRALNHLWKPHSPSKLMYGQISNLHTSNSTSCDSYPNNRTSCDSYPNSVDTNRPDILYYGRKEMEGEMTNPCTTDTMTNLLKTWVDMLKTKDSEKVCSLYAKNAHLNATFENETLSTPEERQDYFKRFLQKDPDCTIITQHYNEGENVVSGTYLFKTNDGNIVKARYTFAYNGAGKIIAHHSSIFPNEK